MQQPNTIYIYIHSLWKSSKAISKGKVLNGTAGNRLAEPKDPTPAFHKALVAERTVTDHDYIQGQNQWKTYQLCNS